MRSPSFDKADGFNIMSVNVFSLLGCLDQLKILIEEEKPHVIGINETKIDSDISDTDIQIEGYEVVRRDRNKWGGGVALYIHKSISANYAVHLDLMHYRLEFLSIQIKLGNFRPFLITAIYLPDVSLDVFQEFESLVNTIDKENKESIIIGDTNCDLLTPSYSHTKQLKTLLTKYELTQLINEPTRITASSKTIIDHIITNRIQYVSDSGVIRCGMSDHDVVYMVKCLRMPLRVRNYKRFNLTGFLEDIKEIPFDQIKDLCDKDANEWWQIWKEFFLDCLNKNAPVINIKVKGNALLYVTSEIRRLIKTRDYLKSKAVKTESNYIQQAFCQVRSKVFSLLKKSRQDYYTRRIEEHKGDINKNLENT